MTSPEKQTFSLIDMLKEASTLIVQDMVFEVRYTKRDNET